jgi:exo-1,4-beta-D-glucosaminidase
LFLWLRLRACVKDERALLGHETRLLEEFLRRRKETGSSVALSSLFLLALTFSAAAVVAGSPDPAEARISLHEGWTLQSSCQVKATGDKISVPGFQTTGWHNAVVPSTVVAALVADKTYPDPDFGMNLRKIPGTTYPIGVVFADVPMPKDSPFQCSWWYRTEFRLPENSAGSRIWLHFNGINYRANIWLNGHKIAGTRDVAGMYRIYEFDISSQLAANNTNALAVETFAQTETDLGINFQDWNPAAPDRDMGLFGDVYLDQSGPVTLRYPEVMTHFPDASLERAELSVIAELHNASSKQVAAIVSGQIEDLRFSRTESLKPNETRAVRFLPADFPQLGVEHPRLWWPHTLGPQNLHSLSLSVAVQNEISDSVTARFGIREITSELNEKGYRQFRINGKKILIRGGGWVQDMLLRYSPQKADAELRYVRDMNLNTIRLEGQLDRDELFDLADERGILVMPGWVCCTYWEKWEKWRPTDLPVAAESLRSQILRLRSHPSMLAWLNGSDKPPPAKVEKAYLKVLADLDWPNPSISSAGPDPTTVTGPSGVKMTGPYDYEPPSYWLTDPGRFGGAFGFNTETGPGAAVPLLGSLQKMLPAEHLWPIDSFWDFHAASESFKNLDRFTGALNATYGRASGLEEYVTKSQAMAYDGQRAMFEAYARNRYTSTGVIQWMINNAWPSLFWHLYDYYLQPGGGYFGTKKACEPLHVQYSYDDRSVVVSNSLFEKFPGLSVKAELYDFDLRSQFSKEMKLDVDSDSVRRAFTIPTFPGDSPSPVYFLRLALRDSGGKLVSSNFYWLARKAANIQWSKTEYFDGDTSGSSIYTPAAPYDDFTALNQLPRVHLEAAAAIERDDAGPRVRVVLKNSGEHLAFQVHLGIQQSSEAAEILPVLWDDNYFELMPGESREISARYLSGNALDGSPELIVDGWNIKPAALPLGKPR